MQYTYEELERRAYIEGKLDEARLYAAVEDIQEMADAEIETAKHDLETVEDDLNATRRELDEAQGEVETLQERIKQVVDILEGND